MQCLREKELYLESVISDVPRKQHSNEQLDAAVTQSDLLCHGKQIFIYSSLTLQLRNSRTHSSSFPQGSSLHIASLLFRLFCIGFQFPPLPLLLLLFPILLCFHMLQTLGVYGLRSPTLSYLAEILLCNIVM